MPSPDEARTPEDDYVVRLEWVDVDDPCFDTVRVVAAVTGRSVLELPPLNDVVDGDPLRTLALQEPTAGRSISFTYAATSVLVDCGEAIEVRPVAA